MDPWLELAKSIHPDVDGALKRPDGDAIAKELVAYLMSATGLSDVQKATELLASDPLLRDTVKTEIGTRILLKTVIPQPSVKSEGSAAGPAPGNTSQEPASDSGTLGDLSEARAAYIKTVTGNGRFDWVAPALSILIPVSFIALVFVLLFRPNAPGADNQVFNIALGSLATAFATVVAFHFGSSVGSKKKDQAQSILLAEREASRSQ
ncbi:hypothetical protein [Rhizobium sp. SG2393]|uniref:hypothetical protein n=1 Tax=Rhizobium sp. SG2393 TaxID=3276279 RepID=UPI00366DCCD0